MLTDSNIEYVHVPGIYGYALAWIIDTECVYAIALNEQYATIFKECNNAVDVSSEYPEHDGITVRLMKDDTILEDFQTSEYFGSILLSNPLVVSLYDYPYGSYAESNKAIFNGNEFVLTGRDMSSLDPYPYGQIKPGDSIS
jgi:hypothetical protein